MITQSFITAAQVALLLDLPTAQSFLRQREDLEHRGFPLPCPWSLRPLKWRRDVVEAWIGGQGLPRMAPGPNLRLVGGSAALLAQAATA